MNASFSYNYLVPVGQALLVAAGGIRILQGMRKENKIEPALTAFAIGIFGLSFYTPVFNWVSEQTLILENQIKTLGDPNALNILVADSLTEEAKELGVPSSVFRLSIWGVVTSLGDLVFLIADRFLKVRRDLLLLIIQFLFPLIWGLYPIFPRFGHSMMLYLGEIFLWGPTLVLVQVAAGFLSKTYFAEPEMNGVGIIALEVVVTFMILNIPRTVHQLIGGTLAPDGESSMLGTAFVAIKAGRTLALNQIKNAIYRAGKKKLTNQGGE